jgi:hypothetical protein
VVADHDGPNRLAVQRVSLDPASRRSSGEIGAASPQNSVTTTNSAPKSSVIGCAALSLRDVEDLLAERGIAVSYETIRRWVNHFGPIIAADLRKRRPNRTRSGIWMRPI